MSSLFIGKRNSKNCKGKNCDFIMYGPGVEKIFEEVSKIFPSKKVEIFSSDYMKKKIKLNLYSIELKIIK